MNREKHILDEICLFSPTGERVRKVLGEVGDHHEAVERFAVRVGRSITMLEAGFVGENFPLSSFILYGSPAAPIHLLVETLSREWLGETWDNRPSFLYIDCSAFSFSYPGVLARLLGPLPRDQYGRQSIPLFSQTKDPHLASLGKDFFRKIWAWKEWFLREYYEDIQRLGEETPRFYLEFENLLTQEQERYRKMLEKEKSFLSVIFFDAVDRACPELIEVIRRILHQGNVLVWPNEFIDFSRSIVIMSIYEYEKVSKMEIGFGKGKGKWRQRVRLDLLRRYQISDLVQDVAENLIVLEERTFEGQRSHLLANLRDIEQRCQGIGILLQWSEDFINRFVKDSQDVALDAFTDARIKVGIRRHIIYPLARLIISQKLRRGSHLLFEPNKDANALESEVIVKSFGGGECIQISDIEKFFSKQKFLKQDFVSEDFQKDAMLRRLRENTESILRRIAGVK